MGKKCVAWVLALVLALCGCSAGGGNSVPAGESSHSSAVEAAAQPTASPAPEPAPATVEGEVARASKSTFELRLEDGSALTVVLTDETQVTGDPLLDGCRATVTYEEAGRVGDTVTAQAVALAAAPPTPSPAVGSSAPEELLASMTLEEKVGQLFFVRVPAEEAAQAVAQYHFGGYILFGRDFQDKTREQVRADIQSYQDSAKVPLLLGVDEEGGTVVRASANPDICDEPYWSPRRLYEAGGLDLVLSVERDKIRTLQGLGLNVNFAPVCDITQQEGAFLYDRSLGQDARTTAGYVGRVVSLYGEEGMGCVLKHFPGYGNNPDTHTGIAVDERPYEAFQREGFLPIEAGVQAGARVGEPQHCHLPGRGGPRQPFPRVAPGAAGGAGLYRLHHHRRPGDGRHPGVLRRLQRGGTSGTGGKRPAVLLGLRDPVPGGTGRGGKRRAFRGAH